MPGPDDSRLRILRELKSSDVGDEALVVECHCLLVQALLKYSKGRNREADSDEEDDEGEDGDAPKKKKKKKRTIMPYGVKASWCSEAFQDVPVAMFAATLSTLYPFVAAEKPGM